MYPDKFPKKWMPHLLVCTSSIIWSHEHMVIETDVFFVKIGYCLKLTTYI